MQNHFQPLKEDISAVMECIEFFNNLANRINEIKRRQDMRNLRELLFASVQGWEVYIMQIHIYVEGMPQ